MKLKNNHQHGSRTGRPVFLSRSLAALCLLGSVFSAGGQVLELESKVTVSGRQVLLKEIVRHHARLPEGWGSREIIDAPPPRTTRRLPLSDVAEALKKYDDMSNVVLRGRTVIDLTSASRPVDVARVQDAVNQYVRSHAAWQGRRFEVCDDQLKFIHVPEAPMKIDVVRLREETDGQTVSAELVLVEGADPIRVSLIELRPYWAFVHPRSRGDMISMDNLEERWLPEEKSARYYSVEQVVEGMELRRNVQAGQLLAQGMLAEPVCIRRGEVIRVVFERGGLRVVLRARALADGRRDESIQCVNERSGQRMYVRMVGPREALLVDEEESEGVSS